MAKPKLLYSTNATLAWRLAKRYYGDVHYIWCTTSFGALGGNSLDVNPPTSQPRWRYRVLHDEVRGNDFHGTLISSTKQGLRTGAVKKHGAGIVSSEQRDEILSIIDQASPSDFKPVLYVLIYDDVKDLLRAVPVEQRANALSEEYIIEELPGDMFDILDLDDL